MEATWLQEKWPKLGSQLLRIQVVMVDLTRLWQIRNSCSLFHSHWFKMGLRQIFLVSLAFLALHSQCSSCQTRVKSTSILSHGRRWSSWENLCPMVAPPGKAHKFGSLNIFFFLCYSWLPPYYLEQSNAATSSAKSQKYIRIYLNVPLKLHNSNPVNLILGWI